MKPVHAFISVFCFVCFPAATVRGEMYTYDVDVELLAPGNHLFRVVGAISYDTVLNDISASSLVLHLDAESVPLTEGPIQDNRTLWHWSATPTELRYVSDQQVPFDLGTATWRTAAGSHPFGQFTLESRNFLVPLPAVSMFYENPPISGGNISQLFEIGPPGFLVGTAAIPEPSVTQLASALLAMVGGAAVWLRRHAARKSRLNSMRGGGSAPRAQIS